MRSLCPQLYVMWCCAVLFCGWMFVCATGRRYLCSVCCEGRLGVIFVSVDTFNQKLSDRETKVSAAHTINMPRTAKRYGGPEVQNTPPNMSTSPK